MSVNMGLAGFLKDRCGSNSRRPAAVGAGQLLVVGVVWAILAGHVLSCERVCALRAGRTVDIVSYTLGSGTCRAFLLSGYTGVLAWPAYSLVGIRRCGTRTS